MKYKKITKEDVYSVLVSVAVDFLNPTFGLISLVEIAGFLKTSRYQVKKYMNILKVEGMVELDMYIEQSSCYEYDDCDSGLPYWGYRLTKKGRDTAIYKDRNKEASEIFNNSFNYKEAT